MNRSVNLLWLIVAVIAIVVIVAGIWAWRSHSQQKQTEYYRQEAIKLQQQEGS